MRVKYKPKPKIPVGSVPRERETTPSAEPGKEATTTTATPTRQPTTTVSSPVTNSVSITEDLRTSQESTVVPLSFTSYTTCSTVSSTKTTDSISNTYLTSGTTLTGLGSNSSVVSSTTRHESDFETSHVATNGITTSTTDYLNASLPDSTNVRENDSHSHPVSNDQLSSSPSFEEGLPTALQAESVAICEDNNIVNTEDTSSDSSRSTVQPSYHRYPSFVESLSSSMSQVASSHRALGLDQPADGELVSTSAVETTYRRRCYEEPDTIDEEMDVFDSCPDDRIATSSSINHPHLQQTEIGGEVEVGNDEENEEAVSKDGDDGDDTTKQTKSKRRRKQPEPKKKRKGSQSEQPASKKQRTDDSQQKKKKKEAPDVTKMTMSELTKYNPKANPMQSTVEARRRKRELKKGKNGVNRTDEDASSTTSSQSSNAGAEQQQEKSPAVEVACKENDLSARLVPQLTVGEDGQIILNERSLTVEATQVERELDSDVVYESSNSYTTNHRYSKKPFYIKNWDEKETQRFYEILSKTGTDFTMMALWLPNRTRMEIKRKFKREEKRNPAKITQALIKIIPMSANNKPAQENT